MPNHYWYAPPLRLAYVTMEHCTRLKPENPQDPPAWAITSQPIGDHS